MTKKTAFEARAIVFVIASCYKLIKRTDLETREEPERFQTKEKEAENGETLRCISSLAKAGF